MCHAYIYIYMCVYVCLYVYMYTRLLPCQKQESRLLGHHHELSQCVGTDISGLNSYFHCDPMFFTLELYHRTQMYLLQTEIRN